MKKLRKKSMTDQGTLIAFTCICTCGCTCACNCYASLPTATDSIMNRNAVMDRKNLSSTHTQHGS